jgi:hypothetical protein
MAYVLKWIFTKLKLKKKNGYCSILLKNELHYAEIVRKAESGIVRN